MALVGCSRKPDASGPPYTPGIAYALTAIAETCATNRGAVTRYECRGRHGETLAVVANARLAQLQIQLVSMTPFEAQMHVVPALRPALGDALATEIGQRLRAMKSDERASIEAVNGGPRVELTGVGPSKLAPVFSIDVQW